MRHIGQYTSAKAAMPSREGQLGIITMSKAKRHKNNRDSPPHVRLERDLLFNNPECKNLSSSSKLLYLYLKASYNSFNNGEIILSYSLLKNTKGISSPKTISKAIRELEKKEWVEVTKRGGMYGNSNRYKLTWKYDGLK